MRTLSMLSVLAALLAGCEDDQRFSPPGLPGACNPEQRACYDHPQDGRPILLRCNDGSVKGAVWVVDRVCAEGEVCEQAACAPVG
ncbi:MAG: hypothetical protein AMXMBFR64_08140 [Myxococcales bacterium]